MNKVAKRNGERGCNLMRIVGHAHAKLRVSAHGEVALVKRIGDPIARGYDDAGRGQKDVKRRPDMILECFRFSVDADAG